MSEAFPRLFSPLALGRVTVKNRIVSTSHDAHFGVNGLPGDRYIRYHVEKAKGGVGLVQAFGTTSVHPTSPGGAGNVNNYDESIIPPFRALADAVHAYGALITCQLVHRGRRASSLASRRPLLFPSDQLNERTGEIPHAMSPAEIRMVVDAYAAAAERTCRAGFDGVEIAMFGDMLPDAFLSPAANTRTDAYGGTFERRLRFPTEVLRAVREAIGSNPLLFVRVSGDDFLPGELSPDERLEVARRLDALKLIDVFSVTGGTVKSLQGRPRHVPSSYFPHGIYLPLAAAYKRAVSVPVLYAGRIVHPQEAETALADGAADLIGMTRAIIADPDMPRKAQAGRAEEIRLCVGANEGCIGRLYQGLPIECVQNPSIGREAELGDLQATRSPRRVVVVGGGPGGLEAARVAAARGHTVTLFERRRELGGQVLTAARAPGRAEYIGIARWLAAQVHVQKVDVRLGVSATRDDVLALRPDVVIIATGSIPRPPSAANTAVTKVIAAREVLDGEAPVGRHVVVLAEDPHMTGPTTADFLAGQGCQVRLISPFQTIGDAIDDTLKPIILQRLLTQGVECLPLYTAAELRPGMVIAQHVLTGATVSLECDSIVSACGGRADDELFHTLKDTGPAIHLIGDALAPRRVHDAMLEATRVARAI